MVAVYRAWVVGLLAVLVGPPGPLPAQQPAGPPRTDRYGDPLPEGAVARLGTVRFRHGDYVPYLAFTPDGKTLVANAADGARAWDAASGELRARFPKETSGYAFGLGCSLAPDGRLLAAPCPRDPPGGVLFWDVATGRQVRSLGAGRYVAACFFPDGRRLAALRIDPAGVQIEFWDVAAGRKRAALPAYSGSIGSTAMLFTPNGRTLVTQDRDNHLRFWDTATAALKRRVPFGPGAGAWKMAFAPDGKILATSGYGGAGIGDHVRLWDAATGRELRGLRAPPPAGVAVRPFSLADVAFAGDGKTVYTAGVGDALIAWDPATGRQLRRIAEDVADPGALALAPDGRAAAVAVGRTAVRVIDLATGRDRPEAGGHRDLVRGIVLTPDGRTAVTVGGPALLRWDLASGRERGRLQGHAGHVTAARLAAGGHTLVSTGADGTFRAWDLATGGEVRQVRLPADLGGAPELLALAPDGKAALGARLADAVVVVDSATGRMVCRVGVDGVRSACFGPDAGTLAVWAHGSRVRLFDAARGAERRQFAVARCEGAARFGQRDSTPPPFDASPDGRTIALGAWGRVVALYDLETGEELQRLGRLAEEPAVLALSADGRALAWGGGEGGIVHVVERATGGERLSFAGHLGGVSALAFSADGRLLVSGGADTTGLVWDLSSPPAGAVPLAAARLDAEWADLAGVDAARAYEAVRRLAAAPREAVPYVRARLRPAAAVDAGRVRWLIADLDSDAFRVRQRAQGELEGLPDGAAALYQRALDARPKLEVRRRLTALLERERRAWRQPTGDRLREVRVVEVLERAGTDAARDALKELAGGGPDARLTHEATSALERLARRPLTGQAP